MKKILVLIAFILIFTSCQNSKLNTDDFIIGTEKQQKTLKDLFMKLEKQDNFDNSFTLIKSISEILEQQAETDKLNIFLLSYVDKYSEDPYNSWYIYKVAENYRHRNINSFADKYYSLILNRYNDLIYKGESIHCNSLMNLIEMTEEPEELIKLYSKLENKFPSKMRTGINYYNLAKTYEKAGEFGNAIKTYRRMINLRDKNIPGGAEKYEYIKEMLVYSSREDKGWLYSNKEKLINNLKYGIRTKNGSVLQRTASRQDFFVVSWAAEEQAVRQGFINNFQRFLQGTWRGPVKYDRDLDSSSNDTEAYLKTYNWSWRIRTWYFYFRKLDFPADPEINGKWEWKGIYVGDKPFSSNESL